MKKTTTLTIEADIIQKAKERQFNISEIAERAIREKLNITEVEIDTSVRACDFCDRKGEKDELGGLTWLWPDERWICSHCFRREENKLRMIKI